MGDRTDRGAAHSAQQATPPPAARAASCTAAVVPAPQAATPAAAEYGAPWTLGRIGRIGTAGIAVALPVQGLVEFVAWLEEGEGGGQRAGLQRPVVAVAELQHAETLRQESRGVADR